MICLWLVVAANKTMSRRINLRAASVTIIHITLILAATVISIALTDFGSRIIAQAQSNNPSPLTLQQKAAMCNPSNPKLKFVNSTESKICGITPTPTPTSIPTNTTATTTLGNNATTATSTSENQLSSSFYKQGYAKGVIDARLVQSKFPASIPMGPDDVDCDSSIDPHASNPDYCSGYQHGFADAVNNVLLHR